MMQKDFANILSDCSKFKSNELPVLFMSSEEAESVKLFSNTYLAMRVSFSMNWIVSAKYITYPQKI